MLEVRLVYILHNMLINAFLLIVITYVQRSPQLATPTIEILCLWPKYLPSLPPSQPLVTAIPLFLYTGFFHILPVSGHTHFSFCALFVYLIYHKVLCIVANDIRSCVLLQMTELSIFKDWAFYCAYHTFFIYIPVGRHLG